MSARSLIVAVAMVGATMLPQVSQARPRPAASEWSGTWRLDLARSRFSAAAPKAEVRSIAVSDGKMTVRSVVTASSGKKMLFYYSVSLDGRFHPLNGNPDGDSIAMRLVDPRSVAITVRRGAKVSARATTHLSGKDLVMDRKRFPLSGSPSEDMMVYDRVH